MADIKLKNTANTEFSISHNGTRGAKSVTSDQIVVAVETINDFPANAETGDTVIVKDLNRGGTFIYDATQSAVNNSGTIFNGWVRQYSGAVNVKWFGAKGDGITDDTIAIQLAMNNSLDIEISEPLDYYYITSSVSPRANTTIRGSGENCYIKTVNGSINGIYINSVDSVTVSGLKLSTVGQTSETAYKSLIYVYNSSNTRIYNNSLFYFGHRAIYLLDSSNCLIKNNIIATAFGSIQDSADIAIIGNSSYNEVSYNICNGINADHGILVQDPYTSTTPIGNTISYNQISEHNAYGIVVYVTTDYDTKTKVIGNTIRDIQGTRLSGASGCGIYIQRAGGTIVSNNSVINCCVQTTNFETLGIGHITATGPSTGNLYPVSILGNSITAEVGPGIFCATGNWTLNISNNEVYSNSTSSARCESIKVQNVARLILNGNIIHHKNDVQSCVYVYANTYSILSAIITNNTIVNTGNSIGLNINNNGSTLSNVICSGNTIKTLSGIALYVKDISSGSFSNINSGNTGTISTYFTGVSNTNVTNSYFYGGNFTTVGTGSNNTVSESVRMDLGTNIVSNGATSGFIISQFHSSAPRQSGLWRVGDRVIQSVPVVGSPKGWRCTVSGNPATWVSEGNL